MLKEKIYLIVGIGTDIGKTFLVENLCKALPDAMAIKPIVSGFKDDDENSDSARILAATRQILNSISPWRFIEAVSPHFAARNSGTEINFSEVKNFCQEKISLAKTNNQFLFIEAAGGVMTPINNEKTFLDLAAELKIPTLLVSANYLGSISHTLCAVEALKSRNVSIEKIIINEDLPTQLPPSLSPNQTIESFSKIAVISLKNLLANKASPK
ncbi:MAG: dethiobiotin synthase [Pseudomonadota bacterium]